MWWRPREKRTLHLRKGTLNSGFFTWTTPPTIPDQVGMMLINPEGHKIHCALCFRFKTSNNEAKYESLITGLCLAKKLQACNIQICSDSQLVVN